MMKKTFVLFAVLVLAYSTRSFAQSLPERLAPEAPFPKILTQASTITPVAAGITEGEYDLQTAAGPIVARAIAVDMHRTDVHVGAILANDKLVSSGETLASMAKRAQAVAGINGDYFDIGATNTPLNILIIDSQLIHPPMQRYAVGIDSDNSVHFQEYFDPPADIVTAIGGGPLLLRNGAWANDLDGPNGAEFMQRIPASGVANNHANLLFLIQVDGNQPGYSIGVTRPELAALMRALGATDGMALDGGGSSSLVARNVDSDIATVQNLPSDGRDRPISDALLVYSDALPGEPVRVVSRPNAIRAIPGAVIPLRFAGIDANGNPVPTSGAVRTTVGNPGIGDVLNAAFTARTAGTTLLHLHNGSVSGETPVTVVSSPARLVLIADTTNFDSGQRAQISAKAYDENGYPLALPKDLPWTATRGTITSDGIYTAGNANATISLHIGGTTASLPVTVGRREVPLAFGRPSFSTAPANGPGGIIANSTCPTCMTLSYDFSGNERAAYAHIDKRLPLGTVGVAFDIFGDNSNALVRVKMTNAINESVLLTAAKLDFSGWHHITARFPASLMQPATLSSVYVLNGIGNMRVTTAGKIAIRRLSMILPAK